MDPIKEAFSKAKQDISDLKESIESLKSQLDDIKRTLNRQTDPSKTPTNRQINPTDRQTSNFKMPLEGLKTSNSTSSIGNRGVPTDRQTDQQTNQHEISEKNELADFVETAEYLKDDIKKRFLSLTKQEREVFFTIYSLENQGFIVDYSMMASKLGLTESSIRDYVLKITRKGIPIQKIKENNKKIILNVAPELKKMASLETISLFYHFN